jgi:hypothetical protein
MSKPIMNTPSSPMGSALVNEIASSAIRIDIGILLAV